jgi:hypothetical protein
VVLLNPDYIWKALEQTHRQGYIYAVVPFPSYEEMCLCPQMKYFVELEESVCFAYDNEWDDENVIVCLLPDGHEGDHGKPGARQLPRGRVE